ncbi:hypothetical protein FTV88_2761 [Heliorestis convoluta]|uniref:Uncharacterized protein n=1 Tax=Heliorestis convoluta TaxID=356322 RepID=A0A5Q2N9A3_9FIRM|nr:hypothetical protein FTV88_2761 [Heliorestis convoluta]
MVLFGFHLLVFYHIFFLFGMPVPEIFFLFLLLIVLTLCKSFLLF